MEDSKADKAMDSIFENLALSQPPPLTPEQEADKERMNKIRRRRLEMINVAGVVNYNKPYDPNEAIDEATQAHIDHIMHGGDSQKQQSTEFFGVDCEEEEKDVATRITVSGVGSEAVNAGILESMAQSILYHIIAKMNPAEVVKPKPEEVAKANCHGSQKGAARNLAMAIRLLRPAASAVFVEREERFDVHTVIMQGVVIEDVKSFVRNAVEESKDIVGHGDVEVLITSQEILLSYVV